jgi:NAD(P)H-dependent flavin oxidoreductase YrpB (nitropropane dioxygenase family)
MLTTRLCRDLAIEHPILCAPLGGGMAGPELAAAVSEAGGLGLLGMGGVPARVIREHIRDTRRRTSKPFGAGLLLPLLEGGEVDAYAIVAQGFEAGGHVRGTTSLMTLIPAVRQAVAPLPVIAAGGIATGRGMLAALSLGAEAVSMGTRFVASEESRAAREYKQRIVRARAEDTVHTMLFDIGWPDAAHRVIRNKALDEWEAAGCPPSGQRPGEGTIVGRISFDGRLNDVPRYFVGSPLNGFEGDLDYTVLYAGESCSLVNEIKPAAAIVRDVVAEAESVLRELPCST